MTPHESALREAERIYDELAWIDDKEIESERIAQALESFAEKARKEAEEGAIKKFRDTPSLYWKGYMKGAGEMREKCRMTVACFCKCEFKSGPHERYISDFVGEIPLPEGKEGKA